MSEYNLTRREVWWGMSIAEVCAMLAAIRERKAAEYASNEDIALDDDQLKLLKVIEQVNKERADMERAKMTEAARQWDYD